jgi:hypothetical protein
VRKCAGVCVCVDAYIEECVCVCVCVCGCTYIEDCVCVCVCVDAYICSI